jgi:hypothetical protein
VNCVPTLQGDVGFYTRLKTGYPSHSLREAVLFLFYDLLLLLQKLVKHLLGQTVRPNSLAKLLGQTVRPNLGFVILYRVSVIRTIARDNVIDSEKTLLENRVLLGFDT